MRYEIYVDSLLFINFTMNLYLLIWVNRSTFRTATPGRIILGALMGAIGFLVTCSGIGMPCVRIIAGLGLGVIGMPVFTFSVRNIRLFLKLLRQLIMYSFLMGGAFLFLNGAFPETCRYLTGVVGISGIATIVFVVFGNSRIREQKDSDFCSATLIKGERKASVKALVDSGNGLKEPISGNPVCVIESSLYEELWGDDVSGIRVIPYHSIGKAKGIMYGFPLERLQVIWNDMHLELANVYVAVSKEPISGPEGADIKMILNPEVLKNSKRRKWKRQ